MAKCKIGIRSCKRKDEKEEILERMNYTLVMDERICDGYYYASAFRLFNVLLRDPWQLDAPPKEIVEDVD